MRDWTPEQRAEYRAKGAITNANNRRKSTAMRDLARKLLDTPLFADDEQRAVLEQMGFEDEEVSHSAAILLAHTLKAERGDVESAKFVRDTSGQRPADMINIGNIDDKPFETLNLSELSDEQLLHLANKRGCGCNPVAEGSAED